MYMISGRPKIKPRLTAIDKVVEMSGRVLMLLLWVLCIFFYTQLPETIPIHFNAAGVVDNYGNKITIFLLPFIGTFVFALLSILNNYPEIFNYPVTITEENAEEEYGMATGLLRSMNLGIAVLFIIISCCFYFAAVGNEVSMWLVITPIILFTLPVVVYIIKATRTKKQH